MRFPTRHASLGAVLLALLFMPAADAQPGEIGPRIDWQWNLMAVRASTAHHAGHNASGIIVAVIDSGIDLNHLDLKDTVWTNSKEVPGNGEDDDGNGYVDDVHGWDWCAPGPAGAIGSSHGTHVAGILAAQVGVHNGVQGVAPGAKLMSLRVLCTDTSGASWQNAMPDLDALQQAVRYARENGAHIISMSLFWNPGLPRQALALLPLVEDEIRRAHAEGLFLVAAAGNTNGGAVQSPANLAGVFAVGATGLGNDVAAYSARGNGIDLWAPGGDPGGPAARGMIYSTRPNGQHGWMSGTSMAAPHVAGAAALLLAREPDLTPTDVAERLVAKAYRLPSGLPLLDVAALLDLPYTPPSLQFLSPRDGQSVATEFAPRVAFDQVHETYTIDFLVNEKPVAYAHRFYPDPLRFTLDPSMTTFKLQAKAYDGRAYTPPVTLNLTHDPERTARGLTQSLLEPVGPGETLDSIVAQSGTGAGTASTPAVAAGTALLVLLGLAFLRRGGREEPSGSEGPK